MLKDDALAFQDTPDSSQMSNLELTVMKLREQNSQLMDKVHTQTQKLHNQVSRKLCYQ